MEMHQVRYFLAVVSTLNFTRAAEKCNVSPPSLIKAIKLLEADLGGELFRRERTRTHLTELGHIVLPYLEQIAASADKVKSETARAIKVQNYTLNIGIMCTLAPKRFLSLIGRFRERWPNINMVIVDDTAAMLEASLLSGDIDIAVYATPGRREDKRLHTIPLFDEEMVIALQSEHPLAKKPVLSPADLTNLPYVERVNCEFGEHGELLFSQRGITGPTICRSERDDWVLGLVASGFGYTFLPIECANYPGVAVQRIENMTMARTINLVTVRGRKHSPGVGAFVRQIARWNWESSLLEHASDEDEGPATLR